MPTIELRRDAWREFFRSFTSQHVGWLCTMEVLGPSLGAQIEARELPFAGISADDEGDRAAVRIALGNAGGAHVSHAIDLPERIYLKQSADGADETLEIEGAGVKTLLTFRVAALPETVDGIAP
jgi:hypothetical protein